MTDRHVPPHDFEAERIIIGLAILDNSKIPELISLIEPNDMYGDKNRVMWEGIVSLACDNKEVSLASLSIHLHEKVAATDIAKVTDGVMQGADYRHYAKIVRHKSKDRKIIQAAARLSDAAHAGDVDKVAALITDLVSQKITGKRDRVLSEEIRKLIEVTSGEFSVTAILNSLESVTNRDRTNVRQILHRLKAEGIIEKSGKKDGVFRRVESDLEPMDFVNAPTEGLEFDWPLDLHEICTIFPKDIICVAGNNNAGKTAFAVDFVRRNMGKHEIYYFNCEMSASRLKDRLMKVDDVPLTGWTFHPFSRDDNFADVIKPNDVNIIDYLEIVDEFWLVAKRLKEIHNKLDQGIAIVLLQKPESRDTGMGGEKGLQKPTLYVAINYGAAKLVKVKSWKGENNPNKHIMNFKLVHGWKFVPQDPWHSEEAEEAVRPRKGRLFL